MIEQQRYIGMVIHMKKDIDYLYENLVYYKKVLKTIFGDDTYKKLEHTLDMLKSNNHEMREDLKRQGLL